MVRERKSQQQPPHKILYVRLPHALAEDLRVASERHFESQSTLVRRLLRVGLDADLQTSASGANR